jgi:poly-gamma-glutamate biosynthesis protein PgsC/CapC
MDPLTVAIGVGLAVSLIFSELFGLAAGGMVVPGYFAIHMTQPLAVVLTLAAALFTYWLVYGLSMVVIIYGKRRTVMMILVGFLIGLVLQNIPIGAVQSLETMEQMYQFEPTELRVIGYIIPGLLAIWIDRQGLVETLSVLITAAVVVRLMLIVLGVEGFA